MSLMAVARSSTDLVPHHRGSRAHRTGAYSAPQPDEELASRSSRREPLNRRRHASNNGTVARSVSVDRQAASLLRLKVDVAPRTDEAMADQDAHLRRLRSATVA